MLYLDVFYISLHNHVLIDRSIDRPTDRPTEIVLLNKALKFQKLL